jgi:glycosyltransferase involved in cell wall biosynthesis
MQIRVIAPLHDEGFEMVQAGQFGDDSREAKRAVEQAAALVVHRGIKKRCRLYQTIVQHARRCGVPVLYDVDDLLIDVHECHPDFAFYQGRKLNALKALLDADLAVVSTPVLADHLTPFQSTFVLPNRLPLGLWSNARSREVEPQARRIDSPLTIGYVGSRSHVPDLAMIEDAIVAVLDHFGAAVRFLSAGVPLPAKLRSHRQVQSIKPSKSVRHDYSKFADFAHTLSFDVGIAPLVDTRFNRCKSDIKFREYAAMGAPSVCSDLPPYASVRHGENGFVAATGAEWIDGLIRLLDSPELRRRLAAHAREEVMSTSAAPTKPTWTRAIAQARQSVRSTDQRERTSLSSIVDGLFEQQAELQRQLKWTVRHQVANCYHRLRRKLAA